MPLLFDDGPALRTDEFRLIRDHINAFCGIYFSDDVRAIVGLPIPNIHQHGPSASHVVLGEGRSQAPAFEVDHAPLCAPDTSLRLFGKPEVDGHRRLGVALARGASLDDARAKAKAVAEGVRVTLA